MCAHERYTIIQKGKRKTEETLFIFRRLMFAKVNSVIVFIEMFLAFLRLCIGREEENISGLLNIVFF